MRPIEPIIDLGKNIIAGTRAAFFMPMQLWSFKSSFLQICLLLIVSLGLEASHNYFESGPDNYFNPSGLSYQSLLYLLFFFSLSLIAFLNDRLRDLEKLIVMFLSVVPGIWLGTICLLAIAKQQTYFDEYISNWLVFSLYSLWYLLVVARLLKRFFYLRVLPTLLYSCLHGLINFAPVAFAVFSILPTEPLWHSVPSNVQAVKQTTNVDIERVYYAQTSLLEKVSSELVESNIDKTDLFFIGFAGDANEDVFMNEAKAAQSIIINSFNAHGRASLLINNKKTVGYVPLANGRNLQSIIAETAKRMNTEEDVLVLFLTSHGSEDHMLSSSFSPFKLKDLSAATIKHALDEAGIRWRVIIISACYSGGFIAPLAGPSTLLITAASSERQSFGCGHNGKYTYFGDAYFEQGLKQTGSFISAFDRAEEIIYERENKEEFKNSEPQISIGLDIKAKLTEFEKELETKRSLNWASSATN